MDKVYLYVANIKKTDNPKLFDMGYKHLSVERKAKVDKLKSNQARLLSIGAELLLKYGLKDIGIDTDTLSFGYKKNNKPYLINKNIEFNLSHSGEFVICAISPSDIGCDIQKIKKVDLKLAKKYFHQKEYDTIMKHSSIKEQQELFFRYWTLKESFIKATGEGMKTPLKDFYFSLDKNITINQSSTDKKYIFQEFDINPNYKCSVCSLNQDIEVKIVNIEDII